MNGPILRCLFNVRVRVRVRVLVRDVKSMQ